MKKQFIVTTGAVCVAALLTVSNAVAVDQAAATGALAEISVASVVAKANLANAAGSGDVAALAEAKKRSDAVDAAVAQGQEAYSEMERALESGDTDAADSAAEALGSALSTANNALAGNFSNEAPVPASRQAPKLAGGPGEPGDAPNIYANPSATAAEAGVAQAVFGNFWNTSAFGTRTGLGDREATPE